MGNTTEINNIDQEFLPLQTSGCIYITSVGLALLGLTRHGSPARAGFCITLTSGLSGWRCVLNNDMLVLIPVMQCKIFPRYSVMQKLLLWSSIAGNALFSPAVIKYGSWNSSKCTWRKDNSSCLNVQTGWGKVRNSVGSYKSPAQTWDQYRFKGVGHSCETSGPLGGGAAAAWSYSVAGLSPALLDSAQLNC